MGEEAIHVWFCSPDHSFTEVIARTLGQDYCVERGEQFTNGELQRESDWADVVLLDLRHVGAEAGLGIDQGLMRVAQELRITHPELCEELDLVTSEIRVGKTRLQALRELAERTGVEDIKALVAMLIQTDRFGTSVAQSLRVHSDDLRMKRRQRAEEAAAKTTIKMVPPLVFFIFPALYGVLLGPAIITIVRTFIQR